MDQRLRDMRSESKTMTPSIIIGKNGLTVQSMKNIADELSRHKLVKIKILQNYINENDKNKVFDEITEKIGARVVHKIGFTITLTKK